MQTTLILLVLILALALQNDRIALELYVHSGFRPASSARTIYWPSF